MEQHRIRRIAAAAGLDVGDAEIAGDDPVLGSPLPVGEAAAVALARVGHEAARLARRSGGDPGPPRTSVAAGAAATLSFARALLDGEHLRRTNDGNPLVAPYRCGDGRWIHLHGGFPHLAAGTAEVLGLADGADADAVAAACAEWGSWTLEDTLAERRLCGAVMRSPDEWLAHPHGAGLASRPTLGHEPVGGGSVLDAETDRHRPLRGVRVLDLTRVLAGPTCGRTLAALGADVLQVRHPDLPHVPAFEIDTGHGKRRAVADLTDAHQLGRVRELALGAHVVVEGYRPGVLRRFGLDHESLRADGFGGVHARISCYGPGGPFSDRAGWEQLAQSATGVTLVQGDPERPRLLPCAATDYTTGLLLAGEVVAALVADRPAAVEASLCQTAMWLLRLGATCDPLAATWELGEPALTSATAWGELRHDGPGVAVDGLHLGWDRPSEPFGSSSLAWET